MDPVRTKEIDFRSLASGRVAQGRRLRVAHRAASPRDRSPRDQAISLDLRGPSTQTKWSESHTSGWVPPPAILKAPVNKSHMSGPFQGLVGLAPLLFGSIFRVHVYPLQDCRPKRVPPQRWQSCRGASPPITPQRWRLRDAKPHKRYMVQFPCFKVCS